MEDDRTNRAMDGFTIIDFNGPDKWKTPLVGLVLKKRLLYINRRYQSWPHQTGNRHSKPMVFLFGEKTREEAGLYEFRCMNFKRQEDFWKKSPAVLSVRLHFVGVCRRAPYERGDGDSGVARKSIARAGRAGERRPVPLHRPKRGEVRSDLKTGAKRHGQEPPRTYTHYLYVCVCVLIIFNDINV